VADELARIGYAGDEPLGQRRFAAFLELHIEQGPILEAEDKTIGIVTGGQGLSWFDGTITGMDSHAGTTPMTTRRDAMAALAELTLAIEAVALKNQPHGVGTVGEVEVRPGSRNTVPGTVRFKGEVRHPERETLEAMTTAVKERAAGIAAARKVDIALTPVAFKPPLDFDAAVVGAVAAAAEANGYPAREMISGAGHDAFYLASTCPTGMIFVPCANGISHNEEESATEADCTAGAQVLLDALLRLDAALSP
jgi:N-carbamoyl-L-amino-acid hydrolase